MTERTGSMWPECAQHAVAIWRESLAGGVVIVAGVAVGWRLGASGRGRLVRVVRWWLEHVLRPLVQSQSWSRRAATIAVNNGLICAAVVLLGSLGYVAWVAVGGVGLGLGIALRLLLPTLALEPSAAEPQRVCEEVKHDPNRDREGAGFLDLQQPLPDERGSEATSHARSRSEVASGLKAIGLALNVLEVPAIMLTAGLSLAQGAMSSAVNLAEALGAFGLLVLPMLLVSAAGEALWMTVDRDFRLDWRQG